MSVECQHTAEQKAPHAPHKALRRSKERCVPQKNGLCNAHLAHLSVTTPANTLLSHLSPGSIAGLLAAAPVASPSTLPETEALCLNTLLKHTQLTHNSHHNLLQGLLVTPIHSTLAIPQRRHIRRCHGITSVRVRQITPTMAMQRAWSEEWFVKKPQSNPPLGALKTATATPPDDTVH